MYTLHEFTNLSQQKVSMPDTGARSQFRVRKPPDCIYWNW